MAVETSTIGGSVPEGAALATAAVVPICAISTIAKISVYIYICCRKESQYIREHSQQTWNAC